MCFIIIFRNSSIKLVIRRYYVDILILEYIMDKKIHENIVFSLTKTIACLLIFLNIK